MSAKPNFDFVRACLTQPRQLPAHLQEDFSTLIANTSAVLNYAEDLERQLAACASDYYRVVAERDSIRQAHAALAAQPQQVSLQQVQVDNEQLRATIAQKGEEYAALEEISSNLLASVQRVTELLDTVEKRSGALEADKKPSKSKPSFILASAVRQAIEGPEASA